MLVRGALTRKSRAIFRAHIHVQKHIHMLHIQTHTHTHKYIVNETNGLRAVSVKLKLKHMGAHLCWHYNGGGRPFPSRQLHPRAQINNMRSRVVRIMEINMHFCGRRRRALQFGFLHTHKCLAHMLSDG